MLHDGDSRRAVDKVSRKPQRHRPDRGEDEEEEEQEEQEEVNLASGRATGFKKSHAVKGLLLLLLCIIQILGTLIFTQGFLLTRLVLDDKSTCEASPDSVSADSAIAQSLDEGCWYQKKFHKAVVIVIDALRYDFTVPFHLDEERGGARQFHNAFPVLYDTAVTMPEHAFLLPFIADPPTTTLQRLKGLTTGTLPTFIDAGSNFAGTAIEEDNLLAQMRSQGKTIVHLGDNTWQSLFPGYFHKDLSHPYDSFNVWDLHTVDDGVTTHLLPLLRSHNSTWDFIFAHFLGVDHAGHRYGPDHPAMREKLQQMNMVIPQVMQLLDEDTLLVVMGDHGMDTKGDHGGESDEEVEAALWMYAAKPLFGRTSSDLIVPPTIAKLRPVRQIDLVSTLSLLLGLPIPFNNIGAPIEEAFAKPGDPDWKALATVNNITVSGIRRYEEQYSKARGVDNALSHDKSYDLAMSLIGPSGAAHDEQGWREAYFALRSYENTILDLYRRLWANFDVDDMLRGIVLLSLGWIYVVANPAAMTDRELFSVAKAGLKGMIIGSCVALTWDAVFNGQLRPSFAAFGLTCGGLITAHPLVLEHAAKRGIVPDNLWSWLAFIFVLSQAAGFASNSYTIHEDTILHFFLTTFGIISCLSSLRQAASSDQVLGTVHSIIFTLLTRMASFSRLCREEQIPGCRSTFYASSDSSTFAPWQVFIPFTIALLLPALVKARYVGTASYVGPAGFWLGFCFRIGLLLIASYWLLEAADSGGWLRGFLAAETLKNITLTLSRSVLGIAVIVGAITVIWAKPCVDVCLVKSSSRERHLEDDTPHAKPTVAILGYANLHGTRYFLLLPCFVLATSLLLPPMGQFAMAICTCQILCLLEIFDSNHLISQGSGSRQKTTSIGPIVLAMLGSFHFFKTGHQATLASIQWNAAFVPLRTITYPFSPLLIILNTFGSQILCAVAVPLTVLWKRPVRRKGVSLMQEDLLGDVMRAMLAHVAYYATIQLATTMWAGHLRRHLMLYRVFMPRFLMACAVLVVVDVVLLMIAWMYLRVNTLSVVEVVGSA